MVCRTQKDGVDIIKRPRSLDTSSSLDTVTGHTAVSAVSTQPWRHGHRAHRGIRCDTTVTGRTVDTAVSTQPWRHGHKARSGASLGVSCFVLAAS